jgi:hypothetical protein
LSLSLATEVLKMLARFPDLAGKGCRRMYALMLVTDTLVHYQRIFVMEKVSKTKRVIQLILHFGLYQKVQGFVQNDMKSFPSPQSICHRQIRLWRKDCGCPPLLFSGFPSLESRAYPTSLILTDGFTYYILWDVKLSAKIKK